MHVTITVAVSVLLQYYGYACVAAHAVDVRVGLEYVVAVVFIETSVIIKYGLESGGGFVLDIDWKEKKLRDLVRIFSVL